VAGWPMGQWLIRPVGGWPGGPAGWGLGRSASGQWPTFSLNIS
jgi:hypothetical protein